MSWEYRPVNSYIPVYWYAIAPLLGVVHCLGGRPLGIESGNSSAQLGATSRPLGVALIGAGMVASTHLEAIIHAPEKITLCGILARNSNNAAALLNKLPANYKAKPKIYETLDQVINDNTVDAAIIVTPPNVREELIKPLTLAGKHILLEKPIARNLSEAEAVVSLCADAKIHLGIVFQHRFRKASKAAKTLVENGTLGKLGVVEISVPWWRDQSYYDELGRGTYERDGGGVLISQAIHTLDLMLSLTGPVKQVQAMVSTSRFHKMESEDFVSAGFEFANGAVGSLSASTCSYPGLPESISLHFEQASLQLEAGILTVNWRNGKVETHGAEATTGGGADPMAFTHEWHQSVLENFSDAIQRDVSPLITGSEALTAHRLIHAIEQSGRQGRTIKVTQ